MLMVNLVSGIMIISKEKVNFRENKIKLLNSKENCNIILKKR